MTVLRVRRPFETRHTDVQDWKLRQGGVLEISTSSGETRLYGPGTAWVLVES